MKCPHCGLLNPPSALRCDCGYDFASGGVKPSYLSANPPAMTRRSLAIWLWAIPLCFVVLLRLTSPAPSRFDRSLDRNEFIALTILLVATPLAWITVAAAVVHAFTGVRATWWVHQSTLAVMAAVALYSILHGSWAQDGPTELGWMPFGQFIAMGVGASLMPLVIARLSRS